MEVCSRSQKNQLSNLHDPKLCPTSIPSSCLVSNHRMKGACWEGLDSVPSLKKQCLVASVPKGTKGLLWKCLTRIKAQLELAPYSPLWYYIQSKLYCSLVNFPPNTGGPAWWLCPFLKLQFTFQHSWDAQFKGFMNLLKLYTKFCVCVFLCLRKAVIFIIVTKRSTTLPPQTENKLSVFLVARFSTLRPVELAWGKDQKSWLIKSFLMTLKEICSWVW